MTTIDFPAVPGDPADTVNWPAYAELLPLVNSFGEVECAVPEARLLTKRIVEYLLKRRSSQEAFDLAHATHYLWRANLGDLAPDTIAMASFEAIALYRLGRLEESQLTVERLLSSLGRTHLDQFPELEIALFAVFRQQGNFAEELNLTNKVFLQNSHQLGANHPRTLAAAINLAGSLRLSGDFAKAARYDEDTLTRSKEYQGEKHTETLLSSLAYGVDQRELGHYAESVRLLEEAWAAHRRRLGDDHVKTLAAIRNLSIACHRAGDYPAAERLAKECLEKSTVQLGESHLDTITAMMGLATIMRSSSQLERSRELAERSYLLFQQNYRQHPFTLIAATNLAATMRLLGETNAACDLDQNAADALASRLGENHIYTLTVKANLAHDLALLSRFSESKEINNQVFDLISQNLGPQHPSTLIVGLNLALDLRDLGEAYQQPHQAALIELQGALGADHPVMQEALRMVRITLETDTMQM